MKSFIRTIALLAVAISVAIPAAAQRSVDFNAYYSEIDPQGDNSLSFSNLDTDIDFEGEAGYGIGLNMFLSNRFSFELAAFKVEPQVIVTSDDPLDPSLALGGLEMIPVTGILQFHLIPNGRIDPFIGFGVAYVLFDNIENLDDAEFDRVDLKNDYGLVGNVGFSLRITPGVSVIVDGRYVPVESSATAVFTSGPDQNFNLEINPVILSAGLSFRF